MNDPSTCLILARCTEMEPIEGSTRTPCLECGADCWLAPDVIIEVDFKVCGSCFWAAVEAAKGKVVVKGEEDVSVH